MRKCVCVCGRLYLVCSVVARMCENVSVVIMCVCACMCVHVCISAFVCMCQSMDTSVCMCQSMFCADVCACICVCACVSVCFGARWASMMPTTALKLFQSDAKMMPE